ncbi:hypothetical protein PDESU_05488 [Pontiella desulfatans]|uniref:Carbohydrate-binding module family 96 domain-containing protein n=1 Tax=Pontiella desulfatans TaxID=2750659 RepID=A0A6C2UCD4_PONDE|nr:DNRLRE domain-containing protein [Pontiella desulfatans]VGO16896.1 hypothetical protein PDESU_05488 [Pontiella desulfatans]
MNKIKYLIIVGLATASIARAVDYYVDASSSAGGDGSFSSPFQTIQSAADAMGAGDTCHIRGGTYHEPVSANGLNGTTGSPITFKNYSNEVVILDGSRPLTDLGSTGWTQHSGTIYKTTLNTDIWQLYVDGEVMISARWPNANFDDGSIWDKSSWAEGDESASSNGLAVDDPHDGIDLAASGLDMTGAMAILNIGSWKTWTREVATHTAGSNSFTYAPATTYLTYSHYYYLEGKLNLLDAEKEWFFDTATKTLYLWVPGGGSPSGDIRGKTQTYAFNITNSQHINLEGLDFFGTTFRFYRSPFITVRDCDLLYPSCSKRMLGIVAEPETSTIEERQRYTQTESAVINCTFRYAESHALHMKGKNNLVENCLFEYTDWSSSELPYLMSTILMDGDDALFRRNTSHTSGASEFFSVGNGLRQIMEYNDISQHGLLQTDGAAAQVTIQAQPGSVIRYNWFHDTPQHGARFDAPIPPVTWGSNGLMHHNVGWNCGADVVMIKGEDHFCYNHTALDSGANDVIILDDPGFGGTLTRNNAAGKLSGHRTIYAGIPGSTDHNWNGYVTGTDVKGQLLEPEFRDFRPRAGSDLIDAGTNVAGITTGTLGMAPDIGAYEYGADNYWIPGYQSSAASHPIPPNNASVQDKNRDLIWLGGYKGASFDVYFGTNASMVAAASTASPEFQGNQTNNIFAPTYPPGNNTWFWRIDTIAPTGTVKGSTWQYTIPDGLQTGDVVSSPLDDSWVFHGDTNNFGSSTQLRMRDYQGFGSRISFLKFSVALPSNSVMSSAVLRIRTRDNPISDTTVRSVPDNNWEEATITGINYPAVGGALDTRTNLFSQTWYQFDVGGFVNSTGIWSLALTSPHNDSARDFNSKEAPYAPELIVSYTLTDSDGDGLSDLWEIKYFSSLSYSDGTGDADLDGLSDYGEFIAGTDPTASASVLAVSVVGTDGTNHLILDWPSVSNRTYAVSGTTNQTVPIWHPVITNIAAIPPMNSETVTTENASGEFFRIEVKHNAIHEHPEA